MLSKDVESLGGRLVVQAAFGNEEWIVGQIILCHPIFEPVIVKVGSQQINAWSSTMPDVDKMSQRTGRRIFSGLASAAVHGSIDVKGKIVNGTGGLGQLLDIFGKVISHEDFIGVNIVAKSDRPIVSPTKGCLSVQLLLQPRMKRPFVGSQVINQFIGHGTGKQFVGNRGMVTGIFEHTNFVLNLHHDNRLCLAVGVGNALHQSGKGTIVGLQHFRREGTGYLQRFTRTGEASGIFLHIFFQPKGGIAAHGVFPGTKPEEYHFQIVLAGLLDSAVNQREIVLPFYRFEEVPTDGSQHGIEPQSLHAGHHVINIGHTGCGRVTQFPANNQHRFPTYFQLGGRALLDKARLCMN